MTTPHFVISRTFAAPRQRVWDAWTDPAKLAEWFGPKGTSGSILAFDLRPGGEWRGRMESADGSVMYSKFVFQEIDPPSKLVWIHGFADEEGNRARAPFAPLFPLELFTTVTFTETVNGTRVDLNWQPIEATPEEEAFFASMMASMEGGWTGTFERLDSFLAEEK